MIRFAAFLAASIVFVAPVGAQYPTKPIRVVVQGPPGSASDTIARVFGQSISASVGQSMVVDNKPGGDGVIAAMEVVKAPPDGYTLLLASNSPMSAVPAMKKSPPYDPVKDFTPITDVGRFTFFLYVNPEVPAKTFSELISYAKANPGKLSYATGNSTGIVGFAQIASIAGIDILHVPYKGEPQGIADVVAGRVSMMWATPTTGLAFVKDERLRVVATSLKTRSNLLPDVPTIYEAGMPQFSIVSWAGLFGPANMPRSVVERINKEFLAAMKRPEVIAAMEKQAFALSPSTPEQLGIYVGEQLETFRAVVKAAGIQPE